MYWFVMMNVGNYMLDPVIVPPRGDLVKLKAPYQTLTLLKSVPEPLRGGLIKTLTCSAALPSNNEVTSNLIKCFTNIGQSPADDDASSILQTGPSQNPQPSAPFTGENASNDIKTQDVSPKSYSTPKAYVGPFMRSNNHNTATGVKFRLGIKCAGCGTFPITGFWYRSKVEGMHRKMFML